MDLPLLLRVFRFALAALVFIAIASQINTLIDDDRFKASNFFSFFTIESNILAASVFLYMAVRPGHRRAPSLAEDLFRGAAVVYMSVTGIVFALLLADIQADLQLTTPWVDTVLHRIMPIAVVLDWLIDPPRSKLSYRKAALWLLFPLVYLAYSLVRGPIVDWYPYPFLDPDTDGVTGIVLNAIGIFVCVSLVSAATAWIGNTLRRRYFTPPAVPPQTAEQPG